VYSDLNLSLSLSSLFFTFTKRIYNYIPNTNRTSRVYNVATILKLTFMVHITLFPILYLLYFYISTFRSVCAVPSMAVFCSSLISCLPGILLRYFLNYFEMVPVAPIITGTTFCFLHSHALSFYCKVFTFYNLLGFFLVLISVS
jgi:hypothetical protein